jgi:hypothetical protein
MNVRIWLARGLSAQDRVKAKDVITPPQSPETPYHNPIYSVSNVTSRNNFRTVAATTRSSGMAVPPSSIRELPMCGWPLDAFKQSWTDHCFNIGMQIIWFNRCHSVFFGSSSFQKISLLLSFGITMSSGRSITDLSPTHGGSASSA